MKKQNSILHHTRSHPPRWLIPVLLVLSAGFLWPLVLHPDQVPMPPVAQNSDLLISHLPNAQYLHRMIRMYGQLPLWNAQMFAGQPFASDPLAGLWYLPNWFIVVFPSPVTFNLLFILHFLWAGLGLFQFLRAEGYSSKAALLGAVVFMGMPKLVGHVAGGHVSLVYAVTWTPWLLLLIRRAVLSRRLKSFVLVGGCLAVIILIDIRWGFFSGLLSTLYGLYQLVFEEERSSVRFNWKLTLGFGTFFLFSVLLSAGLTIPLAEFMLLSSRSDLSPVEAAIYSLSAGDTLGMVFPKPGVYYELIVYLGAAPLLLGLLGVSRRTRFWTASAVLSILFALGPNTFFYPVAVHVLPLLGWLRVPSRVWFIVGLSLAVLAACGMERLLELKFSPRLRRWFPGIAFGVGLFAALLAVGAAFILKPYPKGLIFTGLFFPITLLGIAFRTKEKLPARVVWVLLACVTAVDLLWMDSLQLSTAAMPPVSSVEEWVSQQPGRFRVYSPSDSIPFPSDLEHVNGVNPLHLDSATRFIAQASGYGTEDYSVSLPAIYIDEDTPQEITQAAASPDLEKLGLLNVRYLAADFPLRSQELSLVGTFGDVYLYENPSARPRVWMEGGQAELLEWTPNRITVQANSDVGGQLVLSEVMYTGWQVQIDGEAAELETAYDLLRAVDLPAGQHTVEFIFRPLSVYLGAGLVCLGWIALGIDNLLKNRDI